ncbi:MAG: SHOCT domain-containing protein [Gallionellaceae bacterium]
MWGHMGDYGWGWGGMELGMGLGMLLFWGLLTAGIVMLVKCFCGSGACGKRELGKTALDLLKERYARGEIEREEFEQKKRDLKD